MSQAKKFTVTVTVERTYELSSDQGGPATLDEADQVARERFEADLAQGSIEVETHANDVTGLCIVRNKLGGSEDYTFEDFAEWGAPDDEAAVEIAQWLLEHPGEPYEFDGGEPDCYERYRVTDVDELTRQLSEWLARVAS